MRRWKAASEVAMVVVVSPWTRTQAGRNSSSTGSIPLITALAIERLAPPHHIEIVVGFEIEYPQRLVKHGAVLRSHADTRFDAANLSQGAHDGRHLDSFRARPEDHEHLHSWCL